MMQKVVVAALFTVCMVATAAMQAKPTNYKGLEVTPLGIERAKNVALIDCPPGQNSVRGNARGEEEFAVVKLAFKVTPAFKETVVKKPVLTDTTGKTYNTSVSSSIRDRSPNTSAAFPSGSPSERKSHRSPSTPPPSTSPRSTSNCTNSLEHVAETLDIGPGTRVFEVDCGDGQFLLPLHQNGFIVGGTDLDPEAIRKAIASMADGLFQSLPQRRSIPRCPGTSSSVDRSPALLIWITCAACSRACSRRPRTRLPSSTFPMNAGNGCCTRSRRSGKCDSHRKRVHRRRGAVEPLQRLRPQRRLASESSDSIR